MAFCIYCGARLEENAKFCTNCGARLPENTAPVSAAPAEEHPAEAQSAPSTLPAPYAPERPDGYIYASGDAEKTDRKKKNGAVVFIVLAVLVVIAAVIYVVSDFLGGKSEDKAMLGLYTAQRAEAAGVDLDLNSVWKNGFTIELKDKGKATVSIDGQSGSARWTLNGEAITIKGSGIDCSGTLRSGVLTLEDVMGTGVTLHFTQAGATLSADKTQSGPPKPAGTGDAVGYYSAYKAEMYGIEVDIASVWEHGFTVELQNGGNCAVNVNGTKLNGSWTQTGEEISFDIPGFEMQGKLSDGVLMIEDFYGMGIDLQFLKEETAQPSGKSAAADGRDWWNGDWYGWWTACDGGGDFEDVYGSAWDACARITVRDDDTGAIMVWDQDGDVIIIGEVSFREGSTTKGCMVGSEVTFLGNDLDKDVWTADPGDASCGGFDDLFCISGRATDPENEANWLEYQVYLRPWGTRWEDMTRGDTSAMVYPDDMLPLNYTNWYLPLIEASAPMPESFEGLE